MESAFSPLPEVTLTVWITLMLWRGSVSAHVLNNCVFSSGRGLIQCDWMRLADTVCVCLISAERLRMIGVSDTACFLLGSSSRCGQRAQQRSMKTTLSFRLSIFATGRTHTHTHTLSMYKQTHLCIWAKVCGWLISLRIFLLLSFFRIQHFYLTVDLKIITNIRVWCHAFICL